MPQLVFLFDAFARRCVRAVLRVCLGLTLVQASAAHADETAASLVDLPFEQLLETEVIGASAFVREVTDAPSAVTVVTAEDIQRFGYRTLAEILESMRGLHVGFDGEYHYLAGRGFGKPGDFAGRIMLLIDGYPVADSIFNHLYLGDDGLLDPSVIERVEYVPGPGAAVYGNNAFLGVLHVITRKGRDMDGARLAITRGSHGDRKTRLNFGKRLDNGTDLVLSLASHEASIPRQDDSSDPLPRVHDDRLFLKARQGGWWLEAAWARRDLSSSSSYLSIDSSEKIRRQNSFWQAGYDVDWGDQRASFKLYEGRSLRDRRLDSSWGGFSSSDDYYTAGRWWGGHAQLAGVISDRHRWTVGTEYREETDTVYIEKLTAGEWEFLRTTPGDDVHAWAFYAQDEMRVHPLVDINLGIRYDQHKVLGQESSATNPRVAVVYRAAPDTVLKLSQGTASRRMGWSAISLGNNSLERVRTTELVAEQRWPAQGLRLVGSWYRYRINDLIDSFFDPELTHINTRGVEFDLEWRWRGISLRASHARQMARDNLGRWLANVPRQVSKLQLSVPIDEDRWRASLAWRLTGRRLTDLGNVADSQSVADLTLMRRNLVNGLDLTFAVRNLFDRRYGDVVFFSSDPSGLRWRDGRSYWLQLEYGFK